MFYWVGWWEIGYRWLIFISMTVMVIKFCFLLKDNHKMEDLHILCTKGKDLTELIQGILEL